MIEDVRRQNKSVPAKQCMNVVEVMEESATR